jgi:hypothetical protein
MSCKRSSTYLRHLEHARVNPCSACFYGFAGPVILRICILKKLEHVFGAIRGPDCKQSLILFAVVLHKSFY